MHENGHPGVISALRADRHVDIECPFQALRPEPAPDLIRGHDLVALFGCFVFVFLSGASFASFGRRHINTVFAVGGKYAMKPDQVHAWFRDKRRQFLLTRSVGTMISAFAPGRCGVYTIQKQHVKCMFN